MKKTITSRFTGLLAVTLSTSLLLTGCGASKEIVLYGTEEEYGTAKLCDYSNLAVNKNVYEITEEMVGDEIDSLLYDYIEYVDVDRPSQEGDYITAKMTISAGGEVLYDFTGEGEDGYELALGYEEFGPEFDEKLTGTTKNDTLSFSVSYDADFEIEDLAGQDVKFDVTVVKVTEEVIPALTDDFVKNTLGYESEDALRQSIKENLTKDYEDTATGEMENALLAQIIENSTFEQYPEELLANCRASVEQNYASYMEMFGIGTLDEVYSMFGITEEDIEQEAMTQLHQMMTINQIAREQDLRVSKKEYQEILTGYAQDMEYDSADALLEEYGENNVKFWVAEEKVCAYLTEHAAITEVPASLDDMYADFEESDETLDDADFLLDDMDLEDDDFDDADEDFDDADEDFDDADEDFDDADADFDDADEDFDDEDADFDDADEDFDDTDDFDDADDASDDILEPETED